MGNRTTFVALFFGLVLFAQSSWAVCVIDGVTGAKSKDCFAPVTKTPVKSSGSSSGSTVSCPTQSLSYCFPNNINATKCVIATSDSDARQKCGPGYSYWDLSNPVYRVSNASANVWMCSVNQSKMKICKNAPADKKLNWEGDANSGDCYQIIDGKKDICDFGDMAKTNDKQACDPKQGTWKSSGGRDALLGCYCTNNELANVTEKECGNTCSGANEVASAAPGGACGCATGFHREANSCLANVATPGVSPEMQACVDKHAKLVDDCETSSTRAKQTCNQADKTNPEVTSALNIPNQIANQFIQAKAGSGMKSECFQAGALTNGNKLLMEQMSEKCNESYKVCTNTCGDQKYQEFMKDCQPIATKNSTADEQEESRKGDGPGSADNKYFQEKLTEFKNKYATATPVCTIEAAKEKNILDGLLNGLGNALKASAICACKIAATATGTGASSCDSMPTPAQCLAQPTLALCPAYSVIDKCTMGSADYNAEGCKCQMNPGSCAPGAAAAASGFAGADIKDPAAGGAAFSPTNSKGGGGGGGDIDLGSTKDNPLTDSQKAGAGGPGFLGGGAGGGSGGASGPAGGGDPQAARAEGDGESKGLLGAFNQAKSMVSSLMGGTKPAATSDKNGLNNKFDPNKFRPNGLRGLANTSGIGGKSKNIFDMMQDQYELLQPTLPSVQGH